MSKSIFMVSKWRYVGRILLGVEMSILTREKTDQNKFLKLWPFQNQM